MALEDGREVAAAHSVSWPTVQWALVAYAQREIGEPESTTVLGMDDGRPCRRRGSRWTHFHLIMLGNKAVAAVRQRVTCDLLAPPRPHD